MPSWKQLVPTAIKQQYWQHLHRQKLEGDFGVDKLKYLGELEYWEAKWQAEGRDLRNDHYEHEFLAMAGESDRSFVAGKILADIGCGPRGSLVWAREARARIGIDVLADSYGRFGIRTHDMTYVCAGETRFPLPSGYVDVLFTMNAMDHVDDFASVCREAIRILAPGGLFVGSFNLNEPASVCEPQSLTEQAVQTHLLEKLEVLQTRTAPRGPGDDRYKYFHEQAPANCDAPPVLWIKARKPA